MTLISDIAFTPSVKAAQERRGSRAGYAKRLAQRDWSALVTPELREFLAESESIYLATVNAAGQPYIQHRGGPKGFVRVLDESTLAFADFRGNRQYITTGNLADNPSAFIFAMDYAHRQRIKIWGRARVSDDPALIASLMPVGYDARPEQAIVFTITAWDANCPQHIPQLVPLREVSAAIERLQARVAELEAENATLLARAP